MASVEERLASLETGQADLKADSTYIRSKVDEVVTWMNQQKGVVEGRKPYVTWLVGIATFVVTNILSGFFGAKYAIAKILESVR